MASCVGCRADYGFCSLHHTETMAEFARGTIGLVRDLATARRAHTLAVGRRAAELLRHRDISPLSRDLIVAAATLHDIGYAFPVTGHHAIDGADWLQQHGFPTEVVALVGTHSTAQAEADARNLGVDLTQRYGHVSQLGRAVLWVADFTTSSEGGVVTVGERIADIRQRYPASHPAVRALSGSQNQLTAALKLVDSFSQHAH